MRNKLLLIVFTLCNLGATFAQMGPATGGPVKKTPIDTNQIILIIVAVLLTIGAVAYEKLNLKKA